MAVREALARTWLPLGDVGGAGRTVQAEGPAHVRSGVSLETPGEAGVQLGLGTQLR